MTYWEGEKDTLQGTVLIEKDGLIEDKEVTVDQKIREGGQLQALKDSLITNTRKTFRSNPSN